MTSTSVIGNPLDLNVVNDHSRKNYEQSRRVSDTIKYISQRCGKTHTH